jgi:hypothetical protein
MYLTQNSAFCPHSVFLSFGMVLVVKHLFFLYSIHWLVFLMEVNCVLGAKHEVSPYIQGVYLVVPVSRATAQAVICRPLTAEASLLSQVSPCEIYGGQMALGQVFPPSTSVLLCQCHYTNVPFSSSSTCCSYEKKKRAKPKILLRGNAFS